MVNKINSYHQVPLQYVSMVCLLLKICYNFKIIENYVKFNGNLCCRINFNTTLPYFCGNYMELVLNFKLLMGIVHEELTFGQLNIIIGLFKEYNAIQWFFYPINMFVNSISIFEIKQLNFYREEFQEHLKLPYPMLRICNIVLHIYFFNAIAYYCLYARTQDILMIFLSADIDINSVIYVYL